MKAMNNFVGVIFITNEIGPTYASDSHRIHEEQ
jgi:hypothetical protein